MNNGKEIFDFDSPSIKGLSPSRQWIQQEKHQLSFVFSISHERPPLEFHIYYPEEQVLEAEEHTLAKKQQAPSQLLKESKQIPLKYFHDQRAIREAILLLIKFDHLSDVQLSNRAKETLGSSLFFDEIFLLLQCKMKKMKKTKEELIKYCIRKSFRFITDVKDQKSEVKMFSSVNAFIKNKRIKSMNSEFLKQLFSDKGFHQAYRRFLMELNKYIENDNEKKIDEFWKNICGILFRERKQDKSLMKLIPLDEKRKLTFEERSEIKEIKRMPWTKSIVEKTIQVAYELETYGASSNMKDFKEQSNQLSK